ncbi:MAG: nodulation protein NfeD [bacterium]|nr:nodulation protein NfeD [bacterium]
MRNIKLLFRLFFLSLIILGGVGLALSDGRVINWIRLDGIINPVAAEYIVRGIETAEKNNAECLVLELNTPGGLDSSMRTIIQKMLASKVPVVTYVSPAGGRAASAGVFILTASHIAAMAPGTNLGAAHPVDMQGKSASDKITEDAAAYIRTIAEQRGRNMKWAESAVKRSASATATEAVELKMIDFIAKDRRELLLKLDGMKVKLNDREILLATKNAKVVEIPMSLREQFLHALGHPNVAYVLFILGIYGLIYELASPGFGLAGILGGICIILALVAFESLAFNLGGLLLILFGIALFIADLKTPTHGALTVGGVVALFIGSLLIFSPAGTKEAPYISMGVSLTVIITMVILTTAFFVFAVTKGLLAQRRKTISGKEGIIGATGEVTVELNPNGEVQVLGERWSAYSEQGRIAVGEKIRVVEVDGLRVKVEKLN